MQQLKDLEVNLYRLLLLKGIHFIPLPKRKEEPLIISIDSLSLEEKHKKAIIKFLDKTTPYFSFKNINETLETLKIDNLSKKKSKRKNASATYCISTNKIKILEKDYEKAIYHELFHAHTSYNTLIHYGSGFSKTSIEYLGDSLDEGYTDLISNRYFESEITEQITANMARKVEMIITEEKMRHLYTNNNLKELINSIAKLSSKLEAQKFILLLDDIDTCKKQKRINHFSILSNYLTDLYLEKLIQTHQESGLPQGEIKDNLSQFKEEFTKYAFKKKTEQQYLATPEYKEITEKLEYPRFIKKLTR